MSKDLVTVVGRIKKSTEKARLVEIEGEEVWLPRSQIDFIRPSDWEASGVVDVEIDIPRWLAEKNDLPYEG